MNALTQISPTKAEFAAALLAQPDRDPFRAALDVFGADTAGALAASRDWPHDPEVLEYIDGLSDAEIDEAGVPTLNDLKREAWKRVRACNDAETAFKGLELLRKMIDGDNSGGGNTYVDNRKVMVVQNYGSDDDWEAAAREQQARLINDAT